MDNVMLATCTSLIQSRVKPHLYGVNPEEHQLLSKEVDYMVQNGNAEPSASS